MATIEIKSRSGEKKGDSRDEMRGARDEIQGTSYRRRQPCLARLALSTKPENN